MPTARMRVQVSKPCLPRKDKQEPITADLPHNLIFAGWPRTDQQGERPEMYDLRIRPHVSLSTVSNASVRNNSRTRLVCPYEPVLGIDSGRKI